MEPTNTAATVSLEEPDPDWEEWDGTSPFWVHCVAGSLAGVVEHTALYPLDVVRTHIQVACAACAQLKKQQRMPMSSTSTLLRSTTTAAAAQNNVPVGMFQTIRYLMSEPVALTATSPSPLTAAKSQVQGWTRLWRGVQTVMIGCIPAHALYFSSYEVVKSATSVDGQVTALGSSLAGAAAVTAHDCIMTPIDTVKQRMQLGHYPTVSTAFSAVLEKEGWRAFYRSFPVTLASNIPYGMLMVSTHEAMKKSLEGSDLLPVQTVLISSSLAGFVASSLTTPLDRVKTALQTQELLPVCYQRQLDRCELAKHKNWMEAVKWIYRQEGLAGFFRGMTPRVLSHTPAVAISWTTYETAKQYLIANYHE